MKTNIIYVIALLLLQACLSDEGIKVEKKDGSSTIQFGKRLSMSGATSVTQSACSPIAINVLSLDNQSLNVLNDLVIDLSLIGNGSFYSDSGCSLGITNATIFSGNSLASLYFMSSSIGSSIIRGTATGFGNAELSINVVSPGTVVTPAPTKLKVSGAQSFQKSMCVPLNVTLLDQNNNAFETTSSRTINLSGVSSIFSDSTCSISASSIVLAIGESQKLFYLNVNTAGGHVLTAASSGLLADNFPLVVLDTVTTPTITESNLQLSGPTQFNSGFCVPFNVHLLGSNGLPVNAIASKSVAVTGVPAGQLYSDNTCSSSLVSLSIPVGSSSSIFYLRMPAAGSAVLTSTSSGLVSSSLSVLATEASTSTPPALSKIKISGAQSLQKDLCAPLNLSLLDQFNNSIVAPSATTVNLTGITSVYSDSSCSLTTGTISFSTGESNKLFYIKVAAAGGYVLSGASIGLTGDTFPLVVLDTSSGGIISETNLGISGPQQFVANSCIPFSVNLLGSNGLPMAATSDKVITLGGAVLGNLFSESTCTSNLSSLSDLEILTGSSSASFYLRIPSPGSAVLTVSSVGLIGDNIAVLATSTSSSPVAQALAVQGVYSAGMNDCVPMSATVLNSNNVPMLVTGTTTVNFSTSNSNLEVYSDPVCSSIAASLNLLAGEGILNFYVKGALSGNYMITLASPGLSSANHALNISSAPTVPVPYKLYLSTVSQAVQDVCTPITVTSQDASSNPITVPSNLVISVSDIGDVDFFSDNSCSVAATSATILSGSSTSIFYFKANTGLSAILMASASGLADGQFNLSILPPSGATGSPVQLRILGASGTYNELCGSYLIQSVDENNILRNVTSNKTITLSGVGSGAFYSDSACTTSITSTTIPSGLSSVGVYYRNNSIENILMLATTSGLTQGTLSVVISTNPEALGGIKIEGQGSILTSACTPYSFSAMKNNGGLKTLTANLSFALNSIVGVSWFTNSNCTTPLVSPQIVSGNSSVVYYMKTSTPGSYLVQATSGALNPGVIGVSVGASGTDIGINFEDSDFTVSESHGAITMKVVLTAPAIGNVVLPFTVSGSASRPSDHNLANGNVLIASGQTSGVISFVVYDDPLSESDEEIEINLGTAPAGYYLGSKQAVKVKILDNDTNSLSGADGGIRMIGAGQHHTCALFANGGVKCWGYNSHGQLGNSSNNQSTIPVDVTGLSGVKSLSVGSQHACVITSTNGAKCWGLNSNGSIGDNSGSNRNSPVDVIGLTSGVVSISAGGTHTCAVTIAGEAKCWGTNTYGQLGDNSSSNRLSPYTVTGLTSGIASVSAGQNHTCAVTTGGGVKCWGQGGNYALGVGSSTDSAVPLDVTGLSSGILSVSAGSSTTYAVTAGGGVKFWGGNMSNSTPQDHATFSGGVISISNSLNSGIACALTNSGRALCNGSVTGVTLPNHPELSSGIVSASAGATHLCIVTTSGIAKCLGTGGNGQIGDGLTSNRSVFTPIVFVTKNRIFSKVTTGGNHTCALSVSGEIFCWGYNAQGQLGNGTTSNTNSPTAITSHFIPFTDISAGQNHTCGITAIGGVKCWGQNTYGKLGDGTTSNKYFPTDVFGLTSGVASISAGQSHTCAITTTGGAKCWGYNSTGQLGDGTTTQRTSPADVSGLTSGAMSISAGSDYTCAVTITGGAKCWGNNVNGRLGDGTVIQKNSPVDVSGLTSGVSSISTGNNHTCAVVSGGAKCWGYNNYRQLGDGTTTQRTSPVDVIGFTSGVASVVTGGNNFSCLLTTSGEAKCWGYNSNSQIGIGNTTNQTSPVDVDGPKNIVSISASSNEGHVCSVSADKTVRCWGYNANREIGDGITGPTRPSPSVIVNPVANISHEVMQPRLYQGEKHSCLSYSDKIFCWGDNSFGQLGNGTTLSSSSAVDISAFLESEYVKDMVLGDDHSCFLSYFGDIKCFGRNDRGQFGNGTTLDSLTPVRAPAANAVKLAGGKSYVCASSSEGTYCWGANEFGQLGDGSNADSLSPRFVSPLFTDRLMSGPYSMCANSLVGTFCWGDNSYGQLGMGGAGFNTPQSVGMLFSDLKVGLKHSCGIVGTNIKCSGDNSYGQSGAAPGAFIELFTNISNAPSDLTSLLEIAVGEEHSCVRGGNMSKIYCWGNNSHGQLGQDRLAFSGEPKAGPGTAYTSKLSVGGSTTCFIQGSGGGTVGIKKAQCFGYGQDGQLGHGSNSNSPVPVFVQGVP